MHNKKIYENFSKTYGINIDLELYLKFKRHCKDENKMIAGILNELLQKHKRYNGEKFNSDMKIRQSLHMNVALMENLKTWADKSEYSYSHVIEWLIYDYLQKNVDK